MSGSDRPTGVGTTMLLDQRDLSRLKWRSRRGLLENDLFLERFFARHEATLTVRQADGLNALMALSDHDLLDLLLARREPEGELARDDVCTVLRLLRRPPQPCEGGRQCRPTLNPQRIIHEPV